MKRKHRSILALMTVVITLASLSYANRSVAPREASWEDVLSEAAAGGYKLISTDELWERYQSTPDRLLLVDTRQEWEFRSGHIKGAINFSMEPTWLSRWRKKGELEQMLGADKDRFIVFY